MVAHCKDCLELILYKMVCKTVERKSLASARHLLPYLILHGFKSQSVGLQQGGSGFKSTLDQSDSGPGIPYKVSVKSK